MVCLNRPYRFIFLNVVFHKFYLVHSWILCYIFHFTWIYRNVHYYFRSGNTTAISCNSPTIIIRFSDLDSLHLKRFSQIFHFFILQKVFKGYRNGTLGYDESRLQGMKFQKKGKKFKKKSMRFSNLMFPVLMSFTCKKLKSIYWFPLTRYR